MPDDIQDPSLSDTISEKTKLPISLVLAIAAAVSSTVVVWVETRMTVAQLVKTVEAQEVRLAALRDFDDTVRDRLVRIEAANERIEGTVTEIKQSLESRARDIRPAHGGR